MKSICNECDVVQQDQADRRWKESLCLKCGWKNDKVSDFEFGYVSETPTRKYTSHTQQEPANENKKTDKGQLRITERGSEEDSGNEYVVRLPPSDVLLTMCTS